MSCVLCFVLGVQGSESCGKGKGKGKEKRKGVRNRGEKRRGGG